MKTNTFVTSTGGDHGKMVRAPRRAIHGPAKVIYEFGQFRLDWEAPGKDVKM